MNIITLRIIVVLLSVADICLFNMGMDRINFGGDHGIHPLIAIPICLVITIIIFLITNPEPMWRHPRR